MTEEELEKALEDQTWLVYISGYLGPVLVKITERRPRNLWRVTYGGGRELLVHPDDLRIATPQELLLAED